MNKRIKSHAIIPKCVLKKYENKNKNEFNYIKGDKSIILSGNCDEYNVIYNLFSEKNELQLSKKCENILPQEDITEVKLRKFIKDHRKVGEIIDYYLRRTYDINKVKKKKYKKAEIMDNYSLSLTENGQVDSERKSEIKCKFVDVYGVKAIINKTNISFVASNQMAVYIKHNRTTYIALTFSKKMMLLIKDTKNEAKDSIIKIEDAAKIKSINNKVYEYNKKYKYDTIGEITELERLLGKKI